MARKAVQSLQVTIGSVSGLALASAPVLLGSSVESDKIAAFSDEAFTTVPRNVKSFSEASFTFIDEGVALAGVEALVGTVQTVTITAGFSDGKATATSRAISADMAILSAEPGGDIDGDRKATFVVKAVKHAPATGGSNG